MTFAPPTSDGPGAVRPPPSLDALLDRYRSVRGFSRTLCETLHPEDTVLQSMPDASPVRWHLAHTTWFFETFLLKPLPGYRSPHPAFETLFNSYYNTVGEQFPRAQRGLLSRPTLDEVMAYRSHVDSTLLEADLPANAASVLEIGVNHEQQHQELILTDIKHALSLNPLGPVFREPRASSTATARQARWISVAGGQCRIGHGGPGFAYDNESPRHRVWLDDFQIAGRLVTCEEYGAFIDDGGYRRPEFWLSAGWQAVQQGAWKAPLYWRRDDAAQAWSQFTLAGPRPVVGAEPVTHVSYFEADAYARWAGARLPTEAEWEVAFANEKVQGAFADQRIASRQAIHPGPATGADRQAYGEAWQWTSSAYSAYPGYRPPAGALGEYNGKFMCGSFVLRGASCATPSGHARATYRNFFAPDARWQFTGLRLARDGEPSA
ncbi:Iron(II)-dependent oxidoreductase EgtB [Pirellulimonas nuda]|uniref:Iron(II)-dependent oxidoreductase EgtB n=1 Tax=Pirellulimonas nuda TaxID=2528009 RepID=A0A518DHX5_9BACT|nr:ergothioneine biosynthesis protein EgtB [Pirellulimonas nuda]QDU91075.1 Iron(II)-dependent oxidoreductase EgtB [Pirellulimonas nuda]